MEHRLVCSPRSTFVGNSRLEVVFERRLRLFKRRSLFPDNSEVTMCCSVVTLVAC